MTCPARRGPRGYRHETGRGPNPEEVKRDGYTLVDGSPQKNGCLLASGKLSVGRPDLPLRQSAAEAPADAGTRQAAAPRTLGHDARAELYLRPPEPGHQRI